MHRVPMRWVKDSECYPDPLGDWDEWFMYVYSLRIEAEIHEHGYYDRDIGRWISWRTGKVVG